IYLLITTLGIPSSSMASTKEPSDPNLSPTIVVYHQTRQHQKYVGVACKALSGKEDGPPISLSVYEFMDSDQVCTF
ncbi:unnamed protein product, partial [Heterosigma akashiwo]